MGSKRPWVRGEMVTVPTAIGLVVGLCDRHGPIVLLLPARENLRRHFCHRRGVKRCNESVKDVPRRLFVASFVNGVLRRSTGTAAPPDLYRFGDVTLDFKRHEANWATSSRAEPLPRP